MCSNKTSNISVAILSQVQEFANNNVTFSIHDITRALRQKTQSGAISIPEFATPIGQYSHNIPHDVIKTTFMELLNDSIFTEVNINLDRNSNGVYFEFKPSFIQPNAPIPTPVVNVPTTALNTLVNSVINQVPSVNSTSNVQPAIGGIARRINQGIVENKIGVFTSNHAGQQVTIEQIRAAIKCNGWTCIDIQNVLKNTGASVFVNATYPSKSVVHL